MTAPNASKRSLPYAHLLGGLLGRAKVAKADDTEPPADPKDTDNQDTVDVDELEDQVVENVEEQEDDDDEENGDLDEPAGKRAKKAEEESDTDETAKAAKLTRAARKAERSRCAAIFGAASAGTRPDLAAHLAFNTSMPSARAIALLDAAAAGTVPVQGNVSGVRAGLGARMASEPLPQIGAGGTNKPTTLAQQIIAANEKRLGIAPKK